MLTICLRILSVFGIGFLVLLLLFLFFPVSYRVFGTKDRDGFRVSGRAGWLFGVLRARYQYPDPGKLDVKFFCFPLYGGKAASAEGGGGKKKPASTEGGGSQKKSPQKEKLKYTIRERYDKIKKVWDNISYYAELLREVETRQLFSHACLRLGRIWKNVRPRRIRANVLFGTGAPDTTGYLYGAFCMFAPMLGAGVCVRPDFEEAVLEAEFDLAGHACAGVLLLNICKVLWDRRFQRFLRKVRRGARKRT